MPLKPQDTFKINVPSADIPGKAQKKNPQNAETFREVRTGYGSARDAELNTAGEVTEEQEYAADGLPRTTKYSADRT